MQPLTGWPPGCLLVHLISRVTRLWECPSYSRAMHVARPWSWPLAGHILLVAFILCVTPERVVHSTCMDTRDLGFSLIDNRCVIWDPLLVAHLYFLGFRGLTSPHCLVASRYILMTDVWPLSAPWRTCFARYWPALLVGPAYVAPTSPMV